MFRRMVSLNKIFSCATTAIWLRKSRVDTSRKSTPPIWMRAARRVVKTQQQVGERGFAGTAGADERDELAGLDGEVDVVQHRLFAVIEIHIFNDDVGLVGMEHFGRGGFGHGIFRGEQFKDAFAGGARLVKLVVQPRERFDGRINHHDGQDEGENVRRLRLLVLGQKCMLCWT